MGTLGKLDDKTLETLVTLGTLVMLGTLVTLGTLDRCTLVITGPFLESNYALLPLLQAFTGI